MDSVIKYIYLGKWHFRDRKTFNQRLLLLLIRILAIMRRHIIPYRRMKVNKSLNWLPDILISFWKKWRSMREMKWKYVRDFSREKIENLLFEMEYPMMNRRWLKISSHRESTNFSLSSTTERSTSIGFFLRAAIIHPNGPSFAYVHPQNIYSPPLMHGTHIGKINHFRCNQSRWISLGRRICS